MIAKKRVGSERYMGGSIGILQSEYLHFSQTQNIKIELRDIGGQKKRRDTPMPYSFKQSPTRDYERRFRKLLKVKYNY